MSGNTHVIRGDVNATQADNQNITETTERPTLSPHRKHYIRSKIDIPGKVYHHTAATAAPDRCFGGGKNTSAHRTSALLEQTITAEQPQSRRIVVQGQR